MQEQLMEKQTMEGGRSTYPTDLYYEDVTVGDQIRSDSHVVTAADIRAFAEVTRDRHPLHTDEDYCRNTVFGKTIAHGLFSLSLMEGLKSELELYQNTSVASLGWDKVKFRVPVFAGDRVYARITFLSKRESKSGPHGIAIELIELINEQGQVVTEGEHATLVIKRPVAA